MGHYYETSGGCRGSFSIDYKNHVPIRNYCYNAKCTSSSKRIDESQSLVGVTREDIAREANSDNKKKLQKGQDVVVKLYAEYRYSVRDYVSFCSICKNYVNAEYGIHYDDLCP